MVTTRIPSGSSAEQFDPDEIRRLVAHGKAAGLIRAAADRPPPPPAPPAGKRSLPVLAPLAKDAGAPVAVEAGLRSVWMDVTPEQARAWLERNFRNRPVSEDVVASYARDMLRGAWVGTHQGIAFNDRDELIDGQHRLRAILRAGIPIRLMVTYGLPAKIKGAEMTTMDAVDRGRTRSVADQLKIQHGLSQGSIIAAVAGSLGALCYGERTRRLSVGHTLEVYRAFQPSVDWLLPRRARGHGLRAAGVLAGFAFAMEQGGERFAARIRGYYEQLIATPPAPLEPRRPLAVLRAFLTSEEARLLTRGTDRGVAELVCNAIHLELQGARVDLIDLKPAGRDFFRELMPERVAKISAIFRLPA